MTFALGEGETLGLVGESGCGKTTLSRSLMRLLEPTEGAIRFRGKDITARLAHASCGRCARRCRWSSRTRSRRSTRASASARSSAMPLELHGVAEGRRSPAACASCSSASGLAPEHANRFPHEFSGGQRQRIGVARALALEPRLIVLDEPVSALDVSVQAQIINLLDDLQDDFGLTYLFVAHDLSVVRHVSDRIAVMYLGKLMEVSPAEALYRKPIHPYTGALLAAVPIPDPRENRARTRIVVAGEPPNPIDPPSGCVFHPRCPRATDICRRVEPPLTEYPDGHLAACHHPLNVTAARSQRRQEVTREPPERGRRAAAEPRPNGAPPSSASLSAQGLRPIRQPSPASSLSCTSSCKRTCANLK